MLWSAFVWCGRVPDFRSKASYNAQWANVNNCDDSTTLKKPAGNQCEFCAGDKAHITCDFVVGHVRWTVRMVEFCDCCTASRFAAHRKFTEFHVSYSSTENTQLPKRPCFLWPKKVKVILFESLMNSGEHIASSSLQEFVQAQSTLRWHCRAPYISVFIYHVRGGPEKIEQSDRRETDRKQNWTPDLQNFIKAYESPRPAARTFDQFQEVPDYATASE